MDVMLIYSAILAVGTLFGWGVAYYFWIVPLEARLKDAKDDADSERKRVKKLYKRLHDAEDKLELAKGNAVNVSLMVDDEGKATVKADAKPLEVKAKTGTSEELIDDMLKEVEEEQKELKSSIDEKSARILNGKRGDKKEDKDEDEEEEEDEEDDD